MLKHKDLLGTKALDASEIGTILQSAAKMKSAVLSGSKKLSTLSGKSVFLLFYENSTRTSSSFDHAVKILSGNSINLSVKSSSVAKGETLIDTGMTLDNMGADAMIMRHSQAGAPALLALNVRASVINAGDGMNEHPTQALLDLFTMQEHFGEIKGLTVTIAGDVRHSRVFRSNVYALTKLGARVRVAAPDTLLPVGIENMGVTVYESLDEAAVKSDVIMGLRLQLERQSGGLFPSIAEYSKYYGISKRHIALANKNAIIMHPGPVNRGVEMDSAVMTDKNTRINEQVLNGLAVRMAVLALLLGRE